MRIGYGYDVHRLAKDRKLILGGVEIPHHSGLLGHSDADVLIHAIIDALLGAAALGDIGRHFPDTDAAYKDADSRELLREVHEMLAEKSYIISNIDSTIVAQEPRLQEFIPSMRKNIASDLRLPFENVSVKATTAEKIGSLGRYEGVSATSVVLLQSQK